MAALLLHNPFWALYKLSSPALQGPAEEVKKTN